MASLAQSVISGAQQTAQDSGNTVGDAMQSYHIAATAEHARQELEMQKQDQQLNKSKWFMSTLDGINRMNSGPMQDAAIESAKAQTKSLGMGINPAMFDSLKKDPHFANSMSTILNHYSSGQMTDSDITGLVNGAAQMPTEATTLIHGYAQNIASVKAAQNKAEGIANPRLQMLGWNKHKAAVSGVVDNKPIQQLLSGYQSINNALTNYTASGGMPQELSQLQTQLRLNAGAGGTGVAERAEGYATDLGISKDQAVQILTGKIQDTDLSSPNIVKAIKSIAEAELANKQKQAAQQISKHAAAFQGVYSNDPYASVNKPDFDNAVRQQYQQFDLDENGNKDSSASAPPTVKAAAAAPPATGVTQAPKPPPKSGDVQYDPQTGKTFKVIGDHWVEQQ